MLHRRKKLSPVEHDQRPHRAESGRSHHRLHCAEGCRQHRSVKTSGPTTACRALIGDLEMSRALRVGLEVMQRFADRLYGSSRPTIETTVDEPPFRLEASAVDAVGSER